MEESKKAIENESKIISEEDLEEVAGGDGATDDFIDENCYFVPEHPIQQKKSFGLVWVKCKSHCFSGKKYCKCNSAVFCEHRWHMMENTGDGNMWYPKPAKSFNHSSEDKVVILEAD